MGTKSIRIKRMENLYNLFKFIEDRKPKYKVKDLFAGGKYDNKKGGRYLKDEFYMSLPKELQLRWAKHAINGTFGPWYLSDIVYASLPDKLKWDYVKKDLHWSKILKQTPRELSDEQYNSSPEDLKAWIDKNR